MITNKLLILKLLNYLTSKPSKLLNFLLFYSAFLKICDALA